MKRFLFFFSISALFGMGSCQKSDSLAPSASVAGKGGSMARFALHGDYLYTVDRQNLRVFDVANAESPVQKNVKPLGFDIETIFPYNQYLFIGTETGMQIVSVQDPLNPQTLSTYAHIRACDPVVTQDTTAYITLRSGRTCNPAARSSLEILSVKNPTTPFLVESMSLNSPYGLGVDGNKLFVCDGNAGLKMFRLNSPKNPVQVNAYEAQDTYDVIPMQGLLVMTAGSGIYQFSYDQTSDQLTFRSKINVER